MPTPSSGTRLPAWDVILTNGSTARVRAVSPDDIPAITALHARLSKETVRMRYFGAHPHLSKDELARLVEQEGPDHLALVAELAGQLVGVAQYDRIPGSVEAEVAFVVDDAHQGLGIGTLLLKYLASEGRRFGLKRFAADTLFENSRMVNVFRGAGFTQHSLRGRRRPGGDGHFPHHRCSPCALRARPQGDRPVDAAPAPTAFRGGDRRLPVTGDSGPRTGTEPGQWRFPGPRLPREPDGISYRQRALLPRHRPNPW